ncbi:MAG TPA: ABC transporter family substrate-binding protein [Candidatus Limnocylindrales bacterium]
MALTACAGSGGKDEGPESSIGFADCGTNPNACNNGKIKQGGTITYALGKDVKAWNTLSSAGNTLEYSHALFGVVPRVHVYYPDLSVQVNKDMMESVEITAKEPMTVTYKIRKEAVWNDGTPISADDFIYAWKTQNGKDCKDCKAANTSGFTQLASVTGSDGGKTVTAVFTQAFPDWQQLFSPIYPAHIAAQHGTLGESFLWLEQNVPTYTGGPYKIEKYEPNFALTLVPNEKYYGTKPTMQKVIYRIITKDSELIPAMRNREINAFSPIPTPDLVAQAKQIEDAHWYLGKNLSWEHFDFNLKNPFLADKALRLAMFTAIDRKAIIDKTVGQYAPETKPFGNHNFVPQMKAYKDHVTPTGQGSGDLEKAKKILTDAGYKIEGGKLITPKGETVPTLRMRYTTGNQLRKDSCELFASMVKNLGIQIEIVQTDNLGGTLSSGDFDVMIFAWVNSPLRIGGAKQLWRSDSSSNYGKWVNTESDKLLDEAARTVGDDAKAFDLINKANELMVADAYVLPLFQREMFLVVNKQYTNIRPNPSNHGPVYNVGTWGLLEAAN